MSSAIRVYAVPLERLGRFIGSGDRAAVDAIVAGHAGFLASIDDIDDGAEMTCAAAVERLVTGGALAGPGYLYGYAFEAVCAHVGVELPGVDAIARASRWIEAVDAELARAGVPARLADLVFGGSPVPIPPPDEAPCIGGWPAGTIPEALAAFRSPGPARVGDEMAATFGQIRGWLEEASARPGWSLVGFLS